MPTFTVTHSLTLDADDPKQAAMKAFALNESNSPDTYLVEIVSGGNGAEAVLLEQDDKDNARQAFASGEYSPDESTGEAETLLPTAERTNQAMNDEMTDFLRDRGFKMPGDK